MGFGNHSSTQTCNYFWNFLSIFMQNNSRIKNFVQFSKVQKMLIVTVKLPSFPQIIHYASIKLFHLFKILHKWISVWTSGLQKSLVHLTSGSKSFTKPLEGIHWFQLICSDRVTLTLPLENGPHTNSKCQRWRLRCRWRSVSIATPGIVKQGWISRLCVFSFLRDIPHPVCQVDLTALLLCGQHCSHVSTPKDTKIWPV